MSMKSVFKVNDRVAVLGRSTTGERHLLAITSISKIARDEKSMTIQTVSGHCFIEGEGVSQPTRILIEKATPAHQKEMNAKFTLMKSHTILNNAKTLSHEMDATQLDELLRLLVPIEQFLGYLSSNKVGQTGA